MKEEMKFLVCNAPEVPNWFESTREAMPCPPICNILGSILSGYTFSQKTTTSSLFRCVKDNFNCWKSYGYKDQRFSLSHNIKMALEACRSQSQKNALFKFFEEDKLIRTLDPTLIGEELVLKLFADYASEFLIQVEKKILAEKDWTEGRYFRWRLYFAKTMIERMENETKEKVS